MIKNIFIALSLFLLFAVLTIAKIQQDRDRQKVIKERTAKNKTKKKTKRKNIKGVDKTKIAGRWFEPATKTFRSIHKIDGKYYWRISDGMLFEDFEIKKVGDKYLADHGEYYTLNQIGDIIIRDKEGSLTLKLID